MPFPRILRPLGLVLLLTGASLPAAAQDGFAGPFLAARSADMAGDYRAVVEYGARALSRDPENAGLMEGLLMAQVDLGQIALRNV